MATKRPWRISYTWDDSRIRGVTTFPSADEARRGVANQLAAAKAMGRPFSWRLERRIAPGTAGIRTVQAGRFQHAQDGKALMVAHRGIPPWTKVELDPRAGVLQVARLLEEAAARAELTASVEADTPTKLERTEGYTVVGVYVDDEPVVAAVLQGSITTVDTSAGADRWADYVEAPDPDTAAELAVAARGES